MNVKLSPDSGTGRMQESSCEPGQWFVNDWTLGC
jgi:hypothetical protein